VCRRTLPFEDKVRVNSLNNMEGMNRAYLMATSKSPEKILNTSKKNTTNAVFENTSMTLRDSIDMAHHQSELRAESQLAENLNAINEDDEATGTPVGRNIILSVSDLSRPVTKDQKKSVEVIVQKIETKVQKLETSPSFEQVISREDFL
jgi:hypothetical protein